LAVIRMRLFHEKLVDGAVIKDDDVETSLHGVEPLAIRRVYTCDYFEAYPQ